MTDKYIVQEEEMPGSWKGIWRFAKSLMVMLFSTMFITADMVYLWQFEDSGGMEFVRSMKFYVPVFILFSFALGFDAIAIARALGWGRGEPKPKPVYLASQSKDLS